MPPRLESSLMEALGYVAHICKTLIPQILSGLFRPPLLICQAKGLTLAPPPFQRHFPFFPNFPMMSRSLRDRVLQSPSGALVTSHCAPFSLLLIRELPIGSVFIRKNDRPPGAESSFPKASFFSLYPFLGHEVYVSQFDRATSKAFSPLVDREL